MVWNWQRKPFQTIDMKYICSNCFAKYDFDNLDGFENTRCVKCETKSIQKILDPTLEYWMERCELAENYIDSAERAIEITDKEMDNSRKEWQDFKDSAKVGIEPDQTFFRSESMK